VLAVRSVNVALFAVDDPSVGGRASKYARLDGVTTLFVIVALPTSVLDATTVPLMLAAVSVVNVPDEVIMGIMYI
jgi:hypothetical protein